MLALGIHLGYTKCIVAYCTPKEVKILLNKENEIYTPA
jgi:molecular chaperone DnaK (HSP70)